MLVRRHPPSQPSPTRGEGVVLCDWASWSLLFPRDRAPADVAAAEAFGPVDPVDQRIRLRLRRAHALAQRGHRQHASAMGLDLTLVLPGAAVEHDRVVLFRRDVADDAAGLGRAGIAL